MLGACFGQDGNFTVVVDEHAKDTEGKRKFSEMEAKPTEFKVWASLLAQSSPVFRQMLDSNFRESQSARLVISDFSTAAVENFLRFMYSGAVEGSLSMLIEVAALADKYQIATLHAGCLQVVREKLKPELACEVFACADRFHVVPLRNAALDLIWVEPAIALKLLPNVSSKLLEEILDFRLLCAEEAVLKDILADWARQSLDWEEDALRAVVEDRQKAPKRGQAAPSESVTATLWRRYVDGGKVGAFLGYWASVILGPGQSSLGRENANHLQEGLDGEAGSCPRRTYGKGWVIWVFPQTCIHVICIGFPDEIPSTVSFQILVSEDGATWHTALSSNKAAIGAGTKLPVKRAKFLVKWIKLEVLEGEIVSRMFHFNGILVID